MYDIVLVAKWTLSIETEEIPLPEPYVLRFISLSFSMTQVTYLLEYCRKTAGRNVLREGGLFKCILSDNFIPSFEFKGGYIILPIRYSFLIVLQLIIY